jgi:hypothetical protein
MKAFYLPMIQIPDFRFLPLLSKPVLLKNPYLNKKYTNSGL